MMIMMVVVVMMTVIVMLADYYTIVYHRSLRRAMLSYRKPIRRNSFHGVPCIKQRKNYELCDS